MHPIVSDIYNTMLPNLIKMINKHCNIPNINQDYRKTFEKPPIRAFQYNVSLKQIIVQILSEIIKYNLSQ